MRTFGTVSVPGTRAGAIVSLGLVMIAWIAIPVARIIYSGNVRAGVVGWFDFVVAARAGAEVESGFGFGCSPFNACLICGKVQSFGQYIVVVPSLQTAQKSWCGTLRVSIVMKLKPRGPQSQRFH